MIVAGRLQADSMLVSAANLLLVPSTVSSTTGEFLLDIPGSRKNKFTDYVWAYYAEHNYSRAYPTIRWTTILLCPHTGY